MELWRPIGLAMTNFNNARKARFHRAPSAFFRFSAAARVGVALLQFSESEGSGYPGIL